MSIFSFFLLRINVTYIVTKFIVEETWIFIRTTCTATLYILFCCYQCQPPPSIQYILFNSLHYDDMYIIAVIYSTVAVISSSSPTIEFQSIEKKLRFHRHTLRLDYNTYFSPLSILIYKSSFTKSTITTIATILVTIHIKLLLILHHRGPISSSSSLRYLGHWSWFRTSSSIIHLFSSIYN